MRKFSPRAKRVSASSASLLVAAAVMLTVFTACASGFSLWDPTSAPDAAIDDGSDCASEFSFWDTTVAPDAAAFDGGLTDGSEAAGEAEGLSGTSQASEPQTASRCEAGEAPASATGDGVTATATAADDATAKPAATTAANTTTKAAATTTAKATSTTATATTAAKVTSTTATATTTTRASATTSASVRSDSAYANDIIDLTNEYRKDAGRSALTADETLMNAARIRAEECASLGSIKCDGKPHTRPDGSPWYTVFGVTENYHYGENSGQGCDTPEYMMSLWTGSSGHRANILNSGYTKIGVGCAVSEDGTVFCIQIFYKP